MHARNLIDDFHTLKGEESEKEGISRKEILIKRNDIKVAVARTSRHSRNWRNAHRVSMMLPYVGNQMYCGYPRFPPSSVKFVQNS